jgi:hypothetical protein
MTMIIIIVRNVEWGSVGGRRGKEKGPGSEEYQRIFIYIYIYLYIYRYMYHNETHQNYLKKGEEYNQGGELVQSILSYLLKYYKETPLYYQCMLIKNPEGKK